VPHTMTGAPSSLRAAAAGAPRGAGPNIVYVVMDDFGIGQFAPWAQTLRTAQFDPAFTPRHPAGQALDFARRAMPEMIRLARGGVTFSHSFAPSNLCAPARAGILMGRLPNRDGLYQNSDVEATGFRAGTVLAAHLRKAGYATAFIGKWHAGPRDENLRRNGQPGYEGSVVESHHPLNNGFDYWFGYNHWQSPSTRRRTSGRTAVGGRAGSYNTEVFTQKAIGFMAGGARPEAAVLRAGLLSRRPWAAQTQAPKTLLREVPERGLRPLEFLRRTSTRWTKGSPPCVPRSARRSGRNALRLSGRQRGAGQHVHADAGNAPYAGHKGMFLERWDPRPAAGPLAGADPRRAAAGKRSSPPST